jgi:hypothetical protein
MTSEGLRMEVEVGLIVFGLGLAVIFNIFEIARNRKRIEALEERDQ